MNSALKKRRGNPNYNLNDLKARTLNLIVCILLAAISVASAQKQLVLLKKQKVILRLSYGDEIVYKTKGSDKKITSYVNNLFDTALLAHRTVVPFHTIDRIYFVHGGFVNMIGGALVVGGLGYFLIDQLNVVVVQGEKASLDDNVTRVSIGMAAIGLPMMLIKKKSQRIRGRYRLLAVDYDSPFYQHDLEKMGF